MVDVKVYHNDTIRQYYFHDLLTGMKWLESHVSIDYIVIDNETTVTWEEWDSYVDRLNVYCKEVYGYSY
jgi:hypothetical protein